MRKLLITGQAIKKDIGPGFWGIIDDSGIEYRPINMPEQLKIEGAYVEVVVVDPVEDISIFMWGRPVHIISFTNPKVRI